jgi:uncharacterized membrane protein YvbJ
MECPKCGYMMTQFEKDCPKCARIAKNPPPPIAPIVVPPAAPAKPPISFTYLVFRVGLVMGLLFVVYLLIMMRAYSSEQQSNAQARAAVEAQQSQKAAEQAKARAEKATH